MELNNLHELKKQARALSYHQLQSVVGTLQGVLDERKREVEVIASIQEFASSRGFSLEKLGYTLSNADATILVDSKSQIQAADKKARPRKPKLHSINNKKQLFYFEDGELIRLSSHALKRRLSNRGIQLVTFAELSKKQQKAAKAILEGIRIASLESYNKNVAVWNEWAAANNEEMLTYK